MAWRIVKQPNGLLARFSDIVDNFTHMEMTPEEALDVCMENMGRSSALEKVQRGIDDVPLRSMADEPNDGLRRWRDSVSTVCMIHGLRGFDEWPAEVWGLGGMQLTLEQKAMCVEYVLND